MAETRTGLDQRAGRQLGFALARLIVIGEETEDRWYRAETLRVCGDVLAALGDRAGAEAGYREAIAIAQQQNAKLWELRAVISLARLWRDQCKPSELLTPIYSRFTVSTRRLYKTPRRCSTTWRDPLLASNCRLSYLRSLTR